MGVVQCEGVDVIETFVPTPAASCFGVLSESGVRIRVIFSQNTATLGGTYLTYDLLHQDGCFPSDIEARLPHVSL